MPFRSVGLTEKRAMLKVIRKNDNGQHVFFCPGCKCGHYIDSGWQFNGDYEKPTISPSVLVKSVELPEKLSIDWKDVPLGTRHPEAKDTVCHSFINAGQIQFLDDCTHALKGQTVPLETF
jgi:hypothetical protein